MLGGRLHPVRLDNVAFGDLGIEELEMQNFYGVVFFYVKSSPGDDEGNVGAPVLPPGVVLHGGRANVGEFFPLNGF